MGPHGKHQLSNKKESSQSVQPVKSSEFYNSAMYRQRRPNDAVHWYMNELGSQIVAKSGNTADRFHLGKLILHSLKESPEFVLQIDGGTGQSETNKSVLKRTVQCANAMRGLGLKQGDVMVLMAPNHLDLIIPYYAALYLGVIVAPIDRTLNPNELQATFKSIEPAIIFCQSEKSADVQTSLKELDLKPHIVTVDNGTDLPSIAELLKKHGEDTIIEDFKPADLDPEDAIAILVSTSGTTGLPKYAAGTHKNFSISVHYLWYRYYEFPAPTRMYLIVSTIQWLTAVINIIGAPILRYTNLMTSSALTQDHAYYLINTYKPTTTIMSPTMLATLVKPGAGDKCDFTCFEFISIGGSAVSPEIVDETKRLTPDTEVFDIYGISEICQTAFHADIQPLPKGSSGKQLPHLRYRIINLDTNEDINEPNVPGELWLKGPSIFKGYYNNPAATKETFAEDRWFKTGDMFYRDENWNFYFVDRIKILLKYKNHQVSPVEVENVIRKHAGVSDVAVTGIPDLESGDLIVACVVRREGHNVTAQEIKDLVKESLTDTKQLRGGVVFLKELPTTSTTKLHRQKLKEIVLQVERE